MARKYGYSLRKNGKNPLAVKNACRMTLAENEGGLDEDLHVIGDPEHVNIEVVDPRTENVCGFEDMIDAKIRGERLVKAGKIAEAIAFYQELLGDVPQELVAEKVQELISPAKEDDSGLVIYYEGRDLAHCEICGRKLGTKVWVEGKPVIDGFLWVAPQNGKKVVILGCRACAERIKFNNGWTVWEAFNRIGRPAKENWEAAYEKLAELSGKARRIGGELVPGSWIPIPKNLKGKRVESATARFDQLEEGQVFGGIR